MVETKSSFNLSKFTYPNLSYPYLTSCKERRGSVDYSSTTKRPPTKTSLELYHEEVLNGTILSYNEKLDSILKDVITPKTVTEFAGESGSGKTQVCFQICITVQLPKWCGGFGGESLYINTNNNFSSYRIQELTTNFIDQYNTIKTNKEPLYNFNEDFVLKHIHYIKIKNGLELIACIEALRTFLQNKHIKLVVIDSISHPIRFFDAKLRKNIVCKIFRDLQSLADTYNFAIVITNDLTTRVNEGESYTTPCFGDSFYHLVNNRFILSKRNSVFHIQLAKSNGGSMFQDKETLFYI